MTKAAIVTLIADLKLTPEGRVKILELGSLYRSGYSGYQRLTGQSILQSKVFPFYESLNLPVYQRDGEGWLSYDEDYQYQKQPKDSLGIIPLAPTDAFDPEDISTYGAILSHTGLSTEEERKTMRQAPYDRVLVTHTCGLVNACCDDKFVLAAFANKFAPDLMPQQKLYPINGRLGVDVSRILDDFAGYDTLVIKNASEARAEGVDILKTDSLRFAFRMHAGSAWINLCKRPAFEAGENMLVQGYTPGKTITAANAAGEEGEYESTMRVVFTAIHDKGQTRIVCHDAYHKLPGRPQAEKMSRGSRISNIKDNIGPKSAFVSDEDKALTYRQLEEGLPRLLGPLMTTPSHVFVRELLTSDDVALRRVGVSLAADKYYFDRPAEDEEYPQDIAEGVFENAFRATSRFMPTTSKWGYNDCMLDHLLAFPSLQRRMPEGMAEKLKTMATEKGFRPKKNQYFSSIGMGVMAALVSWTLGAGGKVWWEQREETRTLAEAAQMFAPEGKAQENVGPANIERHEFNWKGGGDSVGIIEQVSQEAEKQGYMLCLQDTWNTVEESRAETDAFAAANPEQSFVGMDIVIGKVAFRNMGPPTVAGAVWSKGSCPASQSPT